MPDAQQHQGDPRDIDLGAHGGFAAPETAADLEVLLEPFEQQLGVPTLLVEPGAVGGRALEVAGPQIERLVLAGRATVWRHDFWPKIYGLSVLHAPSREHPAQQCAFAETAVCWIS
jgi:hypothetical protein